MCRSMTDQLPPHGPRIRRVAWRIRSPDIDTVLIERCILLRPPLTGFSSALMRHLVTKVRSRPRERAELTDTSPSPGAGMSALRTAESAGAGPVSNHV